MSLASISSLIVTLVFKIFIVFIILLFHNFFPTVSLLSAESVKKNHFRAELIQTEYVFESFGTFDFIHVIFVQFRVNDFWRFFINFALFTNNWREFCVLTFVWLVFMFVWLIFECFDSDLVHAYFVIYHVPLPFCMHLVR